LFPTYDCRPTTNSVQEIKDKKSLKSYDSTKFEGALKNVRSSERARRYSWRLIKICLTIALLAGTAYAVNFLYHHSSLLLVTVEYNIDGPQYLKDDAKARVDSYLESKILSGTLSRRFFLAFQPSFLLESLKAMEEAEDVRIVKLQKLFAYQVRIVSKKPAFFLTAKNYTAVYTEDGTRSYFMTDSLAKSMKLEAGKLLLLDAIFLAEPPKHFPQLAFSDALHTTLKKSLFLKKLSVTMEKSLQNSEEVVFKAQVSESVSRGDFTLYTTPQEKADQVTTKLTALLKSLKDSQRKNLSYVDLTYAGKAYVCFKNSPCSTSQRGSTSHNDETLFTQ